MTRPTNEPLRAWALHLATWTTAAAALFAVIWIGATAIHTLGVATGLAIVGGRRREFRELLQRSSLGCPLRTCEHLLSDHGWNDIDEEGDPIDPECSRCRCGADL